MTTRTKHYTRKYFIMTPKRQKKPQLSAIGKKVFRKQWGAFKICRQCGQAKPRTAEFFDRNVSAKKDGLECKCKMCRRPKGKNNTTEFGEHTICSGCFEVLPTNTDNFYSKKGKAVNCCKVCSPGRRWWLGPKITLLHEYKYIDSFVATLKLRGENVFLLSNTRAERLGIYEDDEKDEVKMLEIYTRAQLIIMYTGIRMHIDHIIPVSKGGRHASSNLQILNAKVNMEKSNHIL